MQPGVERAGPQAGSVLGSSYAFSEPHYSELQKWGWLGGLQESLP